MSDVARMIGGAVITAVGIVGIPFSGGASSTLIFAGTSLFLSGLRGAISNRPTRKNAQKAAFNTNATHKVVYGKTRLGSVGSDIWVDDDDISDRESLWTAVAFCLGSEDGSGVEAVEKIWLDDILAIDPVSTGTTTNITTNVTPWFSGSDLLTYSVRRGTHTQGVNTDAQAAASNASDRYPNSFRARGLCYAFFNFWKHKDKFPNYPNAISALIKGNRVYDPRHPSGGPNNDGWVWDAADSAATEHPGQNPALILLDYLTSAKYGAERFYPERDGGATSLSEIDEQSFIDGANYCDESVQDGEGGTQARFKFNDWLDTGNSLQENIGAILSSMRGQLIYQEGMFRLVIPQNRSSSMTVDEDDVIGDWSFHRAGSSKVPNRAVAKFPGGDHGEVDEEVQFPAESDTTFLDQDNGEPQVRTVSLYGVDDPVRAEQILMVNVRDAREDAGVQFTARERVAELEVGDVFTLDHATPGWTGASAKDFRVVAMNHSSDFTIQVTAKEYADSVYVFDSQTRPTPPPGSNLPDPTSTGAPTNLVLTSDSTTQTQTPAGDKVPGILATWDLPTDEGIDRAVVVERENGASEWNTADVVDPGDTQRSLFTPKGGAEGNTWQVGVYVVVGQRQRRSTITTGTETLSTDFQPTDQPTAPSVDASLVSENIVVEEWELVVVPGVDNQGPYQVRARERIEGEGWQAWDSWRTVGTSAGNGYTRQVVRDPSRATHLQFEARDTGRNNFTGPRDQITVKSIRDVLDLPTTGRGPVEEGLGRDGFGGETWGGGRSTAPVYSQGRDTRRYDPIGGVLENTEVFGTSFLRSGVLQTDGQRTGSIQKAHDEEEGVQDGNSVNWSGGAYQAIPQADVVGTFVTYDPTNLDGTKRQALDARPVDVTASGASLRAKVTELVGTTSEQQISFSSDSIGGVGIDGRDFSAQMEDAANSSSAWNDQYTISLDMTAQGETSTECSGQTLQDCQQTCNGGSITVGIYTRDASGLWALRATTSISADCSDTSVSGREVTISVSGLSTGSGPEFATGVEGESGLGGSYTANTVTWETATAPQNHPATNAEYTGGFVTRAKEDA